MTKLTEEKGPLGGLKSLYTNFVKIAFKQGKAREKERASMFIPAEHFVGEKVKQFEKTLHIKVNKPEYFEQALTHRSYLQVKPNPHRFSNERLEFLGDSILGMVVAEYLFDQHSQVQEGELTKMRSWLVNKRSLAICARNLDLEKYMLLSYSAAQSLQKGNESMLADCIEAIIAAIYLDTGLEAARRFVEDTLLPIMLGKSVMRDTNYKSILLEYIQAQGKPAPRYVVVSEVGPDHEKDFTIAAYVAEECLGLGTGKSKKDAEQNAAKTALENKSKI